MTTKAENEILTRVGPGTPMGELFRCYWWPIGFSAHLKDKPTFIRLLCEDLVLFRDGEGRPGLVGAYCSHRRANLCLGRVEKNGLRCRYHGWLYDVRGQLLQTPGEPRESTLKEVVRHPGYPVEELGGLIFAYLGPKPAPLLPRFHFLAADGERDLFIQSFNNSNWLQAVENGLDPFHVSFLHGDVWTSVAAVPERIGFEESEWGAVYTAIRPGRKQGEYNYREHAIVMPGIATGGDITVSLGEDGVQGAALPSATCRWSVPIDDTHTLNVRLRFKPGKATEPRYRKTSASAVPIEPYREYQEAPDSENPTLGYEMRSAIHEEDATMLDSLGPIVERDKENLSVIDEGIILLRKMYLREIEAVRQGRDPKGVIRDEKKNQLIVMGVSYKWISSEIKNQIGV